MCCFYEIWNRDNHKKSMKYSDDSRIVLGCAIVTTMAFLFIAVALLTL